MSRRRWALWSLQVLFWLVPGSALLGANCQTQFRDSVIGASADFLGDSATRLLEALIPLDQMLPGAG